jgi:hypothetical protein
VSILAFLSTTVYSLDLGTGDYRIEVPTLENAADCRYTIKDGKLDKWRNEMWNPEGAESTDGTTLRNTKYYYSGVKAVTAIDQTLKKYRFRYNLNEPVQFACKCGANILIENPYEFCYDWGGSTGIEKSTSRFCIEPFKNELFRSGRLDNLQLVRQLYGEKQYSESVVFYRMGSTYNEQQNDAEQMYNDVENLESTCRCGTNSCEWNTICQKKWN